MKPKLAVDFSTTIEYYNLNADEYAKSTLDVDFSPMRDRFLSYLPKCPHVLEAGCGSGRDSYAFIQKGCRVTAFDGSTKMAAIAAKLIQQNVKVASFDQFDSKTLFDGIWANASFLHIPYERLAVSINRYLNFINPGGIFYLSFKKQDKDFSDGSRIFTCLNEERLSTLIGLLSNTKIIESLTTTDLRPGRSDELWLNVFLKKKVV